MRKQQLIERIRQHNPTAPMAFLNDFDEDQLMRYLCHLRLTCRPRTGDTLWIRNGETPAIMSKGGRLDL